MHGDDEGKGFKGLGKLAGSTPPPVPPIGAGPLPPPIPATPPPTPGASGPGVKPPPPAGSGGSAGCLKVALVVGVMFLGLFLIGLLGRILLAPREANEPAYTPTPVPAADATQAALDSAPYEAEAAAAMAEIARLAACQAEAGARPESGEVLVRTLDAGDHTLKINAGASDGLVKLRQHGRTALAFYVRSHESAEVTDIPDGTYQVMFAGGSGYSRGCGEFMIDMNVSADPDPLVFEMTHEGDSSYFAIMEYTLTPQDGGNFEPEALDPAEFRD